MINSRLRHPLSTVLWARCRWPACLCVRSLCKQSQCTHPLKRTAQNAALLVLTSQVEQDLVCSSGSAASLETAYKAVSDLINDARLTDDDR